MRRQVRDAIGRRLAEIGLELHPDKTRIVYCKDGMRRLEYEQVSFTFCGYAFRPRKARLARLRRRLAGHVRAGPLPHARFMEHARRASVVVVPIRAGARRGEGQQTYLNAIA